MTQSIYEGRGHLSVEWYHGIVYDMQTWKDTFISQQIPVGPQLDKGLNSFPKLAHPFRKSGVISLKAQHMLSLLTPAMVLLLGDAMFTSLRLSSLLLNNLVCVRKIPKINRGCSKTFLGIFL